jgi:hypothetical protein
MRGLLLGFLLVATLGLTACGAGPNAGAARVGDYVGGPVRVECAPFARHLTGVALRGPAADWWWEAEGRYQRATAPAVGSVLVLQRSRRLPYGHVAVVSRVLSSREVMVTQANWVRDRITEDQPVIDVSPRGDWSQVRVWWPPSAQMGTAEYAAFGFIRPPLPPSREQMVAGTPRAIRLALAGM